MRALLPSGQARKPLGESLDLSKGDIDFRIGQWRRHHPLRVAGGVRSKGRLRSRWSTDLSSAGSRLILCAGPVARSHRRVYRDGNVPVGAGAPSFATAKGRGRIDAVWILVRCQVRRLTLVHSPSLLRKGTCLACNGWHGRAIACPCQRSNPHGQTSLPMPPRTTVSQPLNGYSQGWGTRAIELRNCEFVVRYDRLRRPGPKTPGVDRGQITFGLDLLDPTTWEPSSVKPLPPTTKEGLQAGIIAKEGARRQ